MKTVNIHDAKTHLSRLLDEARAGEEIVIAKNGEPIARLLPIQAGVPRRQPGSLKGVVALEDAFFEPLPEDELRAWEGDDGA